VTGLIWAGFIFGLAGSTHCVGMCGPIALMIPVKGAQRMKLIAEILQYHLGRISMYALLGLLIGFLNKGVWLVGIQNKLSIGIGLGLLIVVLFNGLYFSADIKISGYSHFLAWIKKQINQLLLGKQPLRLVILGWLNGLLPCGLVYIALTGAFATTTLEEGTLYMTAFGLGTLPLMALVTFSSHRITPRWSAWIKKLTPLILLLMGIYFIYRGTQIYLPNSYRLGTGLQEDIEMCH
jgi:sulfite exporter TauE/SafE